MADKIIASTLEGEILRRTARKDYGTYVSLANPGYVLTHFHRYLCDKVQEFIEAPCQNGAVDILLLSVPPQHGKSFTITETLPSWYLAKNPYNSVIIAGYESTFAENFGRRNRDKFNTIAQEVFLQQDKSGKFIHDCRPNLNVQAVADWSTAVGGNCHSAGLKGGITGHGADLFIIDDPIKNREQAMSETVIAKIHDEMGPSVQSRLHPGGKLIVIQTRWVENDIIGWVQENWKEYVWEDINLPAEWDEDAEKAYGKCPLGRHIGDSLIGYHLGDDEDKIPERIRNNNRWLQSKKQMVISADGARTWNALYQGRPVAEAGNLYSPEWWKSYERSEEMRSRIEYMQLSIDATFKDADTSDFVAMTLWCVIERKVYLWKLINKRMSFTNTVATIRGLCNDFSDIDELVIEDKANGSAIIDTLMYEPGLPSIVPVQPLGGKFARAQATSNFVSTGVIYLPKDLTKEELCDIENDNPNITQSGVETFINQHKVFPFGKHDDMVDSQSQGLSRILKMIVGEIKMPPHRHFAFYSVWHEDDWQDYNSIKDENERRAYIRTRGAPIEWMGSEEEKVVIKGRLPKGYEFMNNGEN